jgi:Cytochrome P460
MGIGRVTAALVLGVVFTACGGEGGDRVDAGDVPAVVSQYPAPDTTGAAIWAHIQGADYSANWTIWPGKGQFYAGNQPHGMLLTTYMNDVALEAFNAKTGSMPDGAIIVKENYMPDSTLAAVTVMYKRSGYNAEHNDWFFTKHLPTGDLDKMPNGMAMEGRLPGCQNCHLSKKANDYLFTSSLTGN